MAKKVKTIDEMATLISKKDKKIRKLEARVKKLKRQHKRDFKEIQRFFKTNIKKIKDEGLKLSPVEEARCTQDGEMLVKMDEVMRDILESYEDVDSNELLAYSIIKANIGTVILDMVHYGDEIDYDDIHLPSEFLTVLGDKTGNLLYADFFDHASPNRCLVHDEDYYDEDDKENVTDPKEQDGVKDCEEDKTVDEESKEDGDK